MAVLDCIAAERTDGEAINLVWDLFRERPTLGGALVLRQEGEYLARASQSTRLHLHLRAPDELASVAAGLSGTVFGSSALSTTIVTAPAPTGAWPSERDREAPDFSYFSFGRVLALYAQQGEPPRLQWSAERLAAATQVRKQFSGRLVCVHLKYLPPYNVEESNADPRVWGDFFERHAVPSSLEFMLLGTDALPRWILDAAGVFSATALGIDLSTQLCLIGMADGFVGTASGVATAANFSGVPHVLFKHPSHHAAEMQRELGAADRMSFGMPNQLIWRRVVTSEALDEALAIIVP